MASLVNSEYLPGKTDEDIFTQLLTSSSAAPSDYPLSSSTTDGVPTPTKTGVPIRRCSGANYTVQAADTCDSIAAANNIAIYRFLEENGIDFKCHSLSEGSTVCIGDRCLLHEVLAGETCADILRGNEFTLIELLAWHPVIHRSCDNLARLVGRTICISPPGTNEHDVDVGVTWSDDWAHPATGSRVSASTEGVDSNYTGPLIPVDRPTVTAIGNAKAAGIYQSYIQYCPPTAEAEAEGFEWSMLSEECQPMLEPYCDPITTMAPPTSTVFPTTCQPNWIMGID